MNTFASFAYALATGLTVCCLGTVVWATATGIVAVELALWASALLG